MSLIQMLLVVIVSLLSIPGGGFSINLGLGTNNCLLSRLEHVPCHYRRPTQTEKPGPNDMGDYQTRFSGRTCHIIRRQHRVIPIPRTQSSDGSIFYITSPGKLYITPAKCVDFIQVRTPEGNVISDNCGEDKTTLDGAILPFDSIQVIFRSNTRFRFSGFSATATCFTPEQSRSCRSTRTRKKRASSSPAPPNECPASTHEEIRIPYGHELAFSSTSVRSVLSIVNKETNKITKRMSKPPIRTLYIYYMNGRVVKFQHSQREYVRLRNNLLYSRREYTSLLYRYPPIPNRLQGPGILYVPKSTASDIACFQNYLVNVSAYIPTIQEKFLLNDFHSALSSLIDREEPPTAGPFIDGDFDILTRWVPPTITTKPPKFPLPYPDILRRLRYNRAASLERWTDRINQRLLVSALKNDGSCNPIVKVSASVLVKAVERENPAKITSLRRKILTGSQ